MGALHDHEAMKHLDYYLTPLAFMALFAMGTSSSPLASIALGGVGIVLWTFLEYWLHRVLHVGTLMRFHIQHHQRPTDSIEGQQYTCVGVVIAVALAVLFPAIGPLVQGVLLGYMAFLAVHWGMHHDLFHHRTPYFGDLWLKHEEHHHTPKARWFGVTTMAWDYVFRTADKG